MAVEQIRRVEVQRKAAQRKTQELNVDTAITILFGTSRLEGDSFISTLRYARNEGMLEAAMSSAGSTRRVKATGAGCFARSRAPMPRLEPDVHAANLHVTQPGSKALPTG